MPSLAKHLPIHERASFDFIRYSNVWEDADNLCLALKPVAKGKRLLSIASAGGNALALLTLDPKEVVAADLNPAQLALLELLIAGYKSLDHPGLLAFIGVSASDQRQTTYHSLRRHLGTAARLFWDGHPALIESGVIHAGKLERFLRRYQGWLRRWVHDEETIQKLLKSKSAAERTAFYHETWDTWRWRLLNRLAFSQAVLGTNGRDPEFFRHAEDDVTSGPSRRLEMALLNQPLHGNPYLTFQLTGNYSQAALPLHLRPKHFQAIRRRVNRVSFFLGGAEKAPGTFTGFNLSNIFEYMSPLQHREVYAAILAKAEPDARVVYWNLHVERGCQAPARPMKELSKKLHALDQYWAYRSIHVDKNQSFRN
jgi:S-adenosylmethionine-diacylglycerol 3-amino-3-carboxypropyl transferase